jgi:hypothetical protein
VTRAEVQSNDATPRLSAALAGHHIDGGWIFGVVAKRTYIVTGGGRCHVHPEQQPLVEESILSEDDGELLHDSDLVLQRPAADIVVLGHAYAPTPRPAFDASVRVDHFERRIAVFGDRRLERGADGRLYFTSPKGFDRMPLSWTRAYGGADLIALREIGDPMAEMFTPEGQTPDPRFGLFGYPRNPAGKGYLIEPHPEAIEACELPNFEEPLQLLTPDTIVRGDFMLWPNGPMVAALGWMSYAYFPRILQFGLDPHPYNDAIVRPNDFFEVRGGWIKPTAVVHGASRLGRLDIRCTQGSAMGMRTEKIDPGAQIELVHLHPQSKSWRLRLPGEVPRLAFKLDDAPAAYLTPRIRTLLVEPDLDRVTVVWVGETRVDVPVTPKKMKSLQHGVVWPQ